MKIKHRIPVRERVSDVVTEAYQAQVDRDTDRLVRVYDRAEKTLASAVHNAVEGNDLFRAGKIRDHEAAVRWALVDFRRAELLRVEAIMKGAPASAEHRGRKSFGPVPRPGSVL